MKRIVITLILLALASPVLAAKPIKKARKAVDKGKIEAARDHPAGGARVPAAPGSAPDRRKTALVPSDVDDGRSNGLRRPA